MKRLILSLWFALLVGPLSLMAVNGLSADQQKIRTDLVNFLKVEGFSPSLNGTGNICFKTEGKDYVMSVSSEEDNPFYVILYRDFDYPSDYTMEIFVTATKELNLQRGVKVMCLKCGFRIGSEFFVRNAEPVKEAFYRALKNIDKVKSRVLGVCAKTSIEMPSGMFSYNSLPFITTNIMIGNADKNGKLLQDYQSVLVSYKMCYLKPCITVKPYNERGEYSLRLKLYKNNVLQNSIHSATSDYTYSATIRLNGTNYQDFTLPGWRADSPDWEAGKYRLEIWYDNYCVGSRVFTVH